MNALKFAFPITYVGGFVYTVGDTFLDLTLRSETFAKDLNKEANNLHYTVYSILALGTSLFTGVFWPLTLGTRVLRNQVKND